MEDLEVGEDSLRYGAIYTVLYCVFSRRAYNLNILKKTKHLLGFIKSDKNRTKIAENLLHLVFLERL
jgi:hypothetical protein